MVYNFDIKIAKEYGVNEAIMIANFQFWIKKNKANGDNFYDGRYWTYNSYNAFKELFPFWTEQNIKTILKHLKEKGVLITGNYNENKYDHTNWYAFVDEEKWIGYDQPIDKLELTNQEVRTNQSITDNKPYIEKNTKKFNNVAVELKGSFDEFWEIYPKFRAGSKEKAFIAYCKAIKNRHYTIEQIMDGCKSYSKSEEANKDDGKYAKGCAAWLNDDRFMHKYKEIHYEW